MRLNEVELYVNPFAISPDVVGDGWMEKRKNPLGCAGSLTSLTIKTGFSVLLPESNQSRLFWLRWMGRTCMHVYE